MHLLLAMTIAQLFTQSCQNLSKAPATMSSNDQARVVRAVNEGLAEFVGLLPALRRVERRSETLPAPFDKAITATQNSKTFVLVDAWSDQANSLGRTVIVGAESGKHNRLQAALTLAVAYGGATGATTLHVRGDAVVLGASEFAVEGDVVLASSEDSRALTFGPPQFLHDGGDMPFRQEQGNITGTVLQPRLGRPTHWWIEPLNGITGAATPLYILRVWPQPDAAYTLLFDRQLWPSSVTSAMFASTTDLPVLPREEASLVAMCQRGLISSNLWIGSANKDDATKDYERALAVMGAKTPVTGHNQPAQVGTPSGY